ncbi:enoyl-CoA hydratase/isomerase family protein [Novosphingobium bradum]|uniref:Enoyl-CoA hydratase/isomerase family protein n=1 Tax=Novosphingobium bradum TaxID=1737444 RepID=A0ABV7IMZ6_9SPHN
MDAMRLEPWMLRLDWREDERPFALVDLAQWPRDEPFDPLPPVPLVGLGDPADPRAAAMDVVIEPPITLEALATGIMAAPRAAAALVDLLRATYALPLREALVAESFAYAMLQGSDEHRGWTGARQSAPAAPAAPPPPPGHLHVERDGATLALLIDRPEARNAIDRALRDALFDAFTLAALDPAITRIRLAGAGRSFSMGADLTEFGTTVDPVTAHAIRMRTLPALALLPRVDALEVHVQGGCVGSGLELAAFAARLTASADAWFQLPEVGMGIIAGAGGTVSVPRRIGRSRAALLMLSGKRINARTALAWGLVDAVAEGPG